MEQYYLTGEQIAAFASSLVRAERTPATIEKYLPSVRAFFLHLDGQPVTKDAVIAWKEHLQRVDGYSPSTVSASLAALNDLFVFLGWSDCRAHYLKVQHRLFRDAGQELDREDYERLITAARESGRERRTGHGDDLRHRHPSQRGALYHRGGGKGRSYHHFSEGKDPHGTVERLIEEYPENVFASAFELPAFSALASLVFQNQGLQIF